MGEDAREAGGAPPRPVDDRDGPPPDATGLAAAPAEPGAEASRPAAAEREQRRLRPGERVGRFEVTRELGRGGFAVVYEARDTVLWRTVALKLVRASDAPADELIHEAEAVAALHHPCIVTLHEMGSAPGGRYLVFERLEGETLANRLRRGPVPLREALAIAIDVARALDHAHGRGVVHRDLKPGNVFLCRDGGVKVLDFGLAALFGGPAASGVTPGWSAPEQLRDEDGDERTDVYAAAATLLASLRLVDLHGGAAPPRLDGLPRSLARLLAEALAVDPEDRPLSGHAWLLRLQQARRRILLARRITAVGLAATAAAALAWGAGLLPEERPGTESRAARELLARAESSCDAGDGAGCIELLRRAIALDAGFAAAQVRLSRALDVPGQPRSEAQAAIEAALQHARRLSPRDQLLARAWKRHLEGAERGAYALCERAVLSSPDDSIALIRAAEIHHAGEDYPRALEYAERALELAPNDRHVMLLALESDLALGQSAAAEGRARAWLATTPDDAAFQALLGRALTAQRRGEEAVAALERAIALGGERYRSALARSLLALGRCRDAEREASTYLEEARRSRDRLDAGEELHVAQFDVGIARWLLAESFACRGRLREAWAELADHGALAQARALLASGARDLPRARRELDQALRFPVRLPLAAALLADAGDLARAAELAEDLAPDTAQARLHRAVVAWRTRADLVPLREIAAGGDPYGALLLAEASHARGDAGGVVDAVRRFDEARGVIPPWGAPAARLGIFVAAARPRSLLLLAKARRALGDEAGAAAAARELLGLYAEADPELPLVAEARALVRATMAAPARDTAALLQPPREPALP